MHTIGDLQVVGVKKLNNGNYDKWATCMESYLQGQDLWEVVGSNEVTQPEEDANGVLCKWKIIVGWSTQPSLVEFENLLAGQEAMAKQMAGVSLKGEEEALYINKSKSNFKQHVGVKDLRENVTITARRDTLQKIASPTKGLLRVMFATSKPKEKNEDEWDVKASFAVEEEELAFTVTMAE
ncbi:hypothetical protein Pint_16736 [Pistacia integerrima]|uniref:Uncharacterized protein n=1 Tax=Pistacia integerrima TaxID=434235 RepID=A0ACC0ZBK1_9ROSI|nr:hypothetical protein Pint_16736 [Pistacia integerrima]